MYELPWDRAGITNAISRNSYIFYKVANSYDLTRTI